MARTILLADDSVTIQKVIELTFMDQNYEVISVSSGEEALSKLDDVTPGLVIADVHMPGATGYEVSRQVKQRMPSVPVLLLVGTFEPFDEGEFKNCGADRFLKKPFDSQELLRIVGELESAEAAESDDAPAATEAAPAAAAAAPAEDEDPFADFDLSTDSSDSGDPAGSTDSAESGGFRLGMDDDGDEDSLGTSTEAVPAVTEADDGVQLREPSFELEEEPAFEVEEDEGDAVLEAEPVVEAEAVVAAPDTAEEIFEAEAAGASEEATTSAPAGNGSGPLSDEDIDRIAARVAELVGERLVREVAWEVIPDLAEVIIKDRLRELESQVE